MPRKIWTAAEIATLQALYPGTRTDDIASRLGCTTSQVLYKAYQLGIEKSREVIVRMAREALQNPEHPGRRTQFKKGIEPWNKGTEFHAGGRSVDTQFKTGHVASNRSPIGFERIVKGGYLQRKITDTGVTSRDFACVHHIIWREAGREIPPSHALVFKDGNKRNIDLNNLELVSRSDLMRRNSVHNYGQEIARIQQLRGAIMRQINKREGKKNDQAQHRRPAGNDVQHPAGTAE